MPTSFPSLPVRRRPPRRALAILLAATAGAWGCSPPDTPGRIRPDDPVAWVDPFIGTGGHGHVYPGATVPFGMVQVTPVNGRSGWDWSSGYHWSDSVLSGFAHTSLSGTGIGDLLDVVLMPVSGSVDLSEERDQHDLPPWADRLDHAAEEAAPGFYAVQLQRSGIRVELTATPRVGLHRIHYPPEAEAGLVLDLGFSENWDTPTHVELIQVADTLFLGRRYSRGWAEDQRVHFALATSRPVLAVTLAGEEPRLRAHLAFGPAGDDPLVVKVALSYVDEPGALANLQAETPGWAFDAARADAVARWRSELSKIRVKGGSSADRAVFYTALYRTRLAPVLFQDADGRYRGGDGLIHVAEDFTNHSIFSLWDTFRAAHPLNTLVDPDRVHDLVASMMAFRDEHGLLPVWALVGSETNTMTGNHAVPVVVDAALKGLTRIPLPRLLDAVKESQSTDLRDLDDYRAHGWIPTELGVESVTKTLEYAFDDASVARLAAAVGDEATAARFRRRAGAWRHVYDTVSGFMRGRRADGTWVEPFDPLHADHRQNTDYTEGNAWQHSWFVPHDVAGLVGAMGGEEAFVDRLDRLFEQDTVVRGENASPDISGLIGQYAHGNEPSHHIAYLYSWAGRPDRTVERVRQILETQYRATPDGLAGNEDCGQMSAWYVFSALGLYPVDPSSGVYVLGAPRFDEAAVRVQGGTFTVRTHRGAPGDRYVQRVRLNGRPWPLTFLRHADLAGGGVLEVELGSRPDPHWGTERWTRPPSASDEQALRDARARAEARARGAAPAGP